MSLAHDHFLRTMASLGAEAHAVANGAPDAADRAPSASEYELMVLQLRSDKVRLKALQSIEKRIALKRELLPTYAAWVEGRLDAAAQGGRGVQDDVLVTVMLWRIDVGDFDGAIALAQYALTHKLAMPEGFSRGVACILAEQLAESALKLLAAGQAAPAALDKVIDLVAGHDMPDEVRAKVHKALGLEAARVSSDDEACAATGVPGAARIYRERALTELRRALELHDGCGVKTDIKRLEKELNKAVETGQEIAGQG